MCAGLRVGMQPGSGHVFGIQTLNDVGQVVAEGLGTGNKTLVDVVDVLTDVAQERVQPHALLECQRKVDVFKCCLLGNPDLYLSLSRFEKGAGRWNKTNLYQRSPTTKEKSIEKSSRVLVGCSGLISGQLVRALSRLSPEFLCSHFLVITRGPTMNLEVPGSFFCHLNLFK